MKTVSKNSRPAQSRRYKHEKEYQSFFPLLVFHGLEWLPLLLHGLEASLRSWEIKVHMGYLAQIIDFVFINPVKKNYIQCYKSVCNLKLKQ